MGLKVAAKVQLEQSQRVIDEKAPEPTRPAGYVIQHSGARCHQQRAPGELVAQLSQRPPVEGGVVEKQQGLGLGEVGVTLVDAAIFRVREQPGVKPRKHVIRWNAIDGNWSEQAC